MGINLLHGQMLRSSDPNPTSNNATTSQRLHALSFLRKNTAASLRQTRRDAGVGGERRIAASGKVPPGKLGLHRNRTTPHPPVKEGQPTQDVNINKVARK